MNEEQTQETEHTGSPDQTGGTNSSESNSGEPAEPANPETADPEQVGETDEPETEEEKLRHRVEELEEQVAELRDKYQRALAEQQNMQKTHAKELRRVHDQGRESLLEDIAPVLDSLTRAVGTASDDASADQVREGLESTLDNFRKVLEKHGIELIDESGVKYDAQRHQAIHKEESDQVDQPTVSEVYQTGFALEDRVIRPATVQVFVPEEGSESTQDGGAEDEE